LFARILLPFVSLFGPYTVLKVFLCHTLRASSTYSDIVQPSQPYMTIGLIIVLYIFSLVLFDISRDFIILFRAHM
jgi:hypothetical protein